MEHEEILAQTEQRVQQEHSVGEEAPATQVRVETQEEKEQPAN
jgi:hypothetical protein